VLRVQPLQRLPSLVSLRTSSGTHIGPRSDQRHERASPLSP
jgi:hypothetical protein